MSRWTRSLGIWVWVVRDWWAGEPELHLLSALFDRRGAFADVGANAGMYSLTARRFADRVVAFEPNPDLAAGLRAVLGSRAQIREVAASDRDGSGTFTVPTDHGVDHHTRGSLLRHDPDPRPQRHFEVRTAPLDAETLDDLVVLKIDVEGHEGAVLRGARALLERTRASVIVEAEERHHPGTLREMSQIMAGLGYEGWFLYRGELLSMVDFSEAVHQPGDEAPGVGERQSDDYVNNFVWTPAERPALAAALRKVARRATGFSVLVTASGIRTR